MAKTKLLLEFTKAKKAAFEMHRSAVESTSETESVTRSLMDRVSGLGVELDENATPVPFFTKPGETHPADLKSFSAFGAATENPDMKSSTLVVPVEVEHTQIEKLQKKKDVTVWPNSPLTLLADTPLDLASARGGVDCRPFRDGVEIDTLRDLLGARAAWHDGHLGDTVVGIIDEGVNGDKYPVIGGFARPNAARQPGAAPITSHGSMCAADVLVAAPAARILDYPFLGIQNSGGAIQMFQAVLDQRLLNGTPHLTNNSYGFVGVPPKKDFPNHEVHDIDHPVHRKVREVIASGNRVLLRRGQLRAELPERRLPLQRHRARKVNPCVEQPVGSHYCRRSE